MTHPLAHLWEPIAQDLKELEDFLANHLLAYSKAPVTEKIVLHTVANGGKRIRPALFFLSCNLAGYRGPLRLSMAGVSEFVHGASLLHDDVVDQSPTRRGKETAYRIWGLQPAVLVGDFMYARASCLMAQTGCPGIVEAYAQSIAMMSEGELLQSAGQGVFELPEETYFQIIHGKTASLVQTVCLTAGILGDLPKPKQKALGDFGYHLGLAFQIIDDALDYTEENLDVFGKKPLGDLREGKVTLPLIEARGLFSPEDRKRWEGFFSEAPMAESLVRDLAQMVREKQGVEKALERARFHTDQALGALLGGFAPSEERDRLEELARVLLHRVF